MILTRGGRRLLLTEPLPPSPERVRLGTVTYAPTRVLDGVKSLSYAANMLCARIAKENGFDEALLVTPHGRVLEGPTSSIFWVDESGVLCTPPLSDHVLASITRAHMMELVEVKERSVDVEEIKRAQEAFMASTTREGQSVSAIDDREFPETGEVTRKVAAAFAAHRDQSRSRRAERDQAAPERLGAAAHPRRRARCPRPGSAATRPRDRPRRAPSEHDDGPAQ